MYPHLARIGPVTIPTFGAIAALGLVLAILLAAHDARLVRVDEDAIWNLCLFAAAGTLLLSRMLIVAQAPKAFLHYPLYILSLPTVTRYGLLAALLSGLAYLLWKRLPLLSTGDALGPAVLLFQAFLHAGSLFAGDDLGSPTKTWLGRIVPGDHGYHPVALYSALLSVLATAVSYAWLRRQRHPGETFGLSLTMSALIQFFVDELRPDYVLPEGMAGTFLRVDQIILIALVTAGICFFFTRGQRHAQ